MYACMKRCSIAGEVNRHPGIFLYNNGLYIIVHTKTDFKMISEEDKGGDNCFIFKELLQISSCNVVN